MNFKELLNKELKKMGFNDAELSSRLSNDIDKELRGDFKKLSVSNKSKKKITEEEMV